MAYVVGVSSSQEPAATTTFVMSNPIGVQVGDYLVAVCARDNTGTAITSNWTIPTNGELTAGSIRMAVAYTRVSALPASICTFTGASEEWAGCVYLVRDAYYSSADSDAIDVVGNNNDATRPMSATGLAVNYANSLIIVGVGVDSAVNPVPAGGNFVVEDAQDAGSVSFLSGWTVEPTDGTADDIDFYGTTTTNTLVFVKIAIRNATNGRVPAYPATSIHDVIDTGYHRERANAYTNETTNTNFRGWDVDDPDYVYQDDGGVFTDLTTAATNDTDADVAYPTTEAVNDALYIGNATPFYSLVVDRAGCTVGAGGAFAIEYWNGSAWTAVPKRYDQTGNFVNAVADGQVINWRAPSNEATTTVNSVSAYWIRLRCTTLWTTNPTLSRIRIAEAGLVYDGGAATADTGIVPFWSSWGVSPANTAAGSHAGAVRDLGTDIDLDVAERYLVGTYLFSSPREYYDTGAADLGYGIRFPLLDSSNNYRSWIIGGYAFPGCYGDRRSTFAVQPSQTVDTSHSESVTAPDFDVARKWVTCNGSYADEALSVYFSYIAFANRAIINGGATNGPANWSDVKRAVNGTLFPYYNQGQFYIPVQFGGDKQCIVDVDLATFDFKPVALTKYGNNFHVDEGVLGVIIKGASGDSIKIRNSTITSETRIRFEVDAAASGSATYDFTGTTVVNATVTLRNVATFAGMNFINCPTFVQNSAPLSGCSFSGTKVTSATLADMEDISDCAFTSGGTGYAIEVSGTASTITFSGNTFTGYASSNGSTGNEAIYVNIASGTVTLNITGGGSTPSIRTAGATVVVQNAVTVKVTVKDVNTGANIENARVLIEKVSDGTDILTGLTNSSGVVTTSYAYTSDTAVTGKVRRASDAYGTLYKTSPISATITSTGLDITVLLIPD